MGISFPYQLYWSFLKVHQGKLRKTATLGSLTSISSTASEPDNTPQRKPLKESWCSCVCWCAQATRLQLCTIQSVSQRLRSLKITRRDRCGLQLIFFFSLHSFCDQVSAEFPWCRDVGFHGPMACKPPIQTPCKGKCLFVVCSHNVIHSEQAMLSIHKFK